MIWVFIFRVVTLMKNHLVPLKPTSPQHLKDHFLICTCQDALLPQRVQQQQFPRLPVTLRWCTNHRQRANHKHHRTDNPHGGGWGTFRPPGNHHVCRTAPTFLLNTTTCRTRRRLSCIRRRHRRKKSRYIQRMARWNGLWVRVKAGACAFSRLIRLLNGGGFVVSLSMQLWDNDEGVRWMFNGQCRLMDCLSRCCYGC